MSFPFFFIIGGSPLQGHELKGIWSNGNDVPQGNLIALLQISFMCIAAHPFFLTGQPTKCYYLNSSNIVPYRPNIHPLYSVCHWLSLWLWPSLVLSACMFSIAFLKHAVIFFKWANSGVQGLLYTNFPPSKGMNYSDGYIYLDYCISFIL